MKRSFSSFTADDGNAWLERNRDKLGVNDPVSDLLQATDLKPTSVLEIGCSNGWRLAKLRLRYGCAVFGIDPSPDAVAEANSAGVVGWIGSATSLPAYNRSFDLVILGFCLYLCDPDDYFRIVAESDRVLDDGGLLIIHDFADTAPYRRRYEHREGLWSYHMNFARLWDAHPHYHIARRIIVGEESVTMLKKSTDFAFPVKP